MSYCIELTDYASAKEAIQFIRQCVFIEEQGIPAELEWDQHDNGACFALALDAHGQAIGTARLLSAGKIGRMAVLPTWRYQGVGRALLTALLQAARDIRLKRVYLSAQTSATGFYEKCGFQTEGHAYQEAGIPHQDMWLAL